MTKDSSGNGDMPTGTEQAGATLEPENQVSDIETETVAKPSAELDDVVDRESEIGADDSAEDGATEEPTQSEIIAQLQEELSAAIAAKEEAENKLKYEAAEFQNIRKRQEQRLSDAISRANAELIKRLLPILDDFDMAFKNVPETLMDGKENGDTAGQLAWLDGFKQIHKKLLGLLEEQGVTPIDASGEFDPTLHEAILSEPNDDVESGHVIDVLRTGYEYRGQVLRAAMVRVAA